MRYAQRRELDDVLNGYDAVIGVFGTPAQCLMLRSVRVPAIAKVATLIALERRQLISSLKGVRRLVAKANLHITAKLDEKGLQTPDRLMVINEWMFNYCRERVGSKVELAPPGVDTDFYIPLRSSADSLSNEASKSADSAPYFLFVGRLGDPRKDIQSLLRAYKIAVNAHGVTQKLILAGRGDIRPDDYRLISDLGIHEQVEVISDVSAGALLELYQRADLFVLSSAEEGLGIVLLEAMSCGVPVVSSATEGARYAIGDEEVGELIELGPGFVEALASALSHWSNDENARSRAGVKARQRAVEKFSYAAMSERYAAALISGRRGIVTGDGARLSSR
jgi:glycosyltransferase involved in cell wall biosynthesis